MWMTRQRTVNSFSNLRRPCLHDSSKSKYILLLILSTFSSGSMDAHTLELLEFHKVRDLVAGYAACSLGKELARQLEPSTDVERIRSELALVTEMTEALGKAQAPPFGGLHDVRLLVRRAAIGAI